MDEAEAAADCKFCSAKGTARYTCPRCNARYCSVECYRVSAHLSCSESFYRDCFMEGLRTMQPESSERMKLMEMLRRLETDAELDDDGADDLTARFADVDIDSCSSEVIWQRLTESERADFGKFASSDQVCGIVELWVPWWCAPAQAMVEEIGKESTTALAAIPPVLTDVPHIEQLAKCGTSDLIPFSIINVLYAYAYVARLYNGEHFTMASESVSVMLDISECLSRGVFTDVALAVGACLSRLDGSVAAPHFISREYSVSVVGDVCKIVAGAASNRVPFPLAALSDCHRVFRAARKEARQHLMRSRSGDTHVDEHRKRCFAVEKKLEYLISWTLNCGGALLDLLPALELESCELTTQLSVHQSQQARVEEILEQQKSAIKQSPLIEEISSTSLVKN